MRGTSRGTGSVVAHAAVSCAVAASACTNPAGPDDVACMVSTNPAIPLASGLVPASSVTLAVGETCALRAETGSAFRIMPTTVDARYLIAVQSASEVPAARASLTLTVAGPEGLASVVPSRSLTSASEPVDTWASDAELRLRRNALRELARRGARPSRRSGQGSTPFSSFAVPPSLGDTLIMSNSVDAELSVDCMRDDMVPAVVRAVGQDIVIVEDVDAAGHITDAQYADIIQDLDDPVFRIGEAYFGSPADLDGNERVIAFVTPIVNRATPRGTSTFIAGFFNPSDLSDPESCPASNHGEVLYLLAPDPAGVFGDPVAVDLALKNTVSVTAHELTHLIVAEQRLVIAGGGFADLDDSWIDEGLAHTSEMVVGFAAAGLAPRGNHDFAQLSADLDAFNTYHLSNFRRIGYNLLNPARTLALGDEGGRDPGGIQSLEMRGFATLLFRWIADQADLPGGGVLGGVAEEALFRDLASGGSGLSTGIPNVVRVTDPALGASTWRELVQRYALAPLADDAEGSPTEDSQVTSLRLPDIFAGIHEAIPDKDPFKRPYPLLPTTYDAESGGTIRVDFDLLSGASGYLIVESRGGDPVDIRLATGSGGGVANAVKPQVVIQRTN